MFAQRTYHEAATYCKIHYGTTLATITSDAENREASALCKQIAISGTPRHCWIGLQQPFHGKSLYMNCLQNIKYKL